MSLPLPWIERIFAKLTLTYGTEFQVRWGGFDKEAMHHVHLDWAHELSAFKSAPHAIAFALEHLPERAPNVIAFRNLCLKAPAIEQPRIDPPKADPVIVAAVLEKIVPVTQQPRPYSDHKAWAKRILQRLNQGENINPTTAQMARTALGQHTLEAA
jgi:hypothetical protein